MSLFWNHIIGISKVQLLSNFNFAVVLIFYDIRVFVSRDTLY